MARQTTDRELPFYETAADPPDGASQQQDLAEAIGDVGMFAVQGSSLPAVPPQRTRAWHTGARVPFYSDGANWIPEHGLQRRTVTANTTLELTDTARAVDVSSASNLTVTVPPQSSVAWLDGTTIEVTRLGSGDVTIAAGSGVTLRPDDDPLKIAKRYAAVELQRLGTDEWLVLGLLG